MGDEVRVRRMEVVKRRAECGVGTGVEEYPRPGKSEENLYVSKPLWRLSLHGVPGIPSTEDPQTN